MPYCVAPEVPCAWHVCDAGQVLPPITHSAAQVPMGLPMASVPVWLHSRPLAQRVLSEQLPPAPTEPASVQTVMISLVLDGSL